MKLHVTVEGKVYEVEVEVVEPAPGSAPIGGGGPNLAPPPTVAPGASRVGGGAAKSAGPTIDVADEKAVKSPIAGNVVKVNVEPGQDVAVDDTVLLLEAMKMETAVTSPVAGKVKAVHTAVGTAVKAGQVLIEFE